MSTLPRLGNLVKLFGVGCQGCGHFRGEFEVESVLDGETTKLVVWPREIHCEGAMEGHGFPSLTLVWNRALECWEAECLGHSMVVNIGGHFRGPARSSEPAGMLANAV